MKERCKAEFGFGNPVFCVTHGQSVWNCVNASEAEQEATHADCCVDREERDALITRVAALYGERDRCVAMLASVFPSSLERHSDADTTWENDWRWIVYVDLPTGQASWHIHDSELPLFAHVPRLQGRVWDGHTTEEKYARLARAAPLIREVRV